MSAIFSPVLCRQTLGSATVDTLVEGARSCTISGSVSGIAVGDHLFVAKNDYTQCEYLGKVTAITSTTVNLVTTTTVYFQFRAQSTRDTASFTYRLHTPNTFWQAASVPGTGGVIPSWESGIETLDTTGKEMLHTRTKEPRDYVELVIQDAMAGEFHEFKQWIQSELDGGLYQFVAAYMDQEAGRTRCDVVKFRQPGQALRAVEKARVLRSFSIELQVVQRDYFVAS